MLENFPVAFKKHLLHLNFFCTRRETKNFCLGAYLPFSGPNYVPGQAQSFLNFNNETVSGKPFSNISIRLGIHILFIIHLNLANIFCNELYLFQRCTLVNNF